MAHTQKTRTAAPDNPRTDKHDKARRTGPALSPGSTEATRPRDHEDEVQKGPGSASADLQMTSDGRKSTDDHGGRSKP